MVGYEQLSFNIRGIVPLLMHNGRLSNPLDGMAKLLKSVTVKKKKTDSDYELMAQIEFVAGLYTSEPIEDIEIDGKTISATCSGKLIIPSDNWETCFIEAAKKNKLGQQAKAGLLFDEDSIIIGCPSVAAMLSDPDKWFFTKRVKVQRNAVMRTRPILRQWICQLNVKYLPDLFNAAHVQEIARIAGQLVGVGDYRPKYGRFEIQ